MKKINNENGIWGWIFGIFDTENIFILMLFFILFSFIEVASNRLWSFIVAIVVALIVIRFITDSIAKKYRDIYMETSEKYEEQLNNIQNGIPTKQECKLYKNEMEEITKKYEGAEWIIKTKEFILKKRLQIKLTELNSEKEK